MSYTVRTFCVCTYSTRFILIDHFVVRSIGLRTCTTRQQRQQTAITTPFRTCWRDDRPEWIQLQCLRRRPDGIAERGIKRVTSVCVDNVNGVSLAANSSTITPAMTLPS